MNLPVPLRRFYKLDAELGIPGWASGSDQRPGRSPGKSGCARMPSKSSLPKPNAPELFDHKYVANLGLSGPKSQLTRRETKCRAFAYKATHTESPSAHQPFASECLSPDSFRSGKLSTTKSMLACVD
jgi:hypothetical protein